MSTSYFDQTSVSDGTNVNSFINVPTLVTEIQAYGVDTYFDNTSKIGPVYVYYVHQDGRQMKKIVHDNTSHQGIVQWSSNAHDGTWLKDHIKAFDHDGAFTVLPRAAIGTGEDCTHASGHILLNNA